MELWNGPVSVACERADDGWRCTVAVAEVSGAVTYRVALTAADLERLAPDGTPPERLVQESFAFLLEREPREAILRAFELPVIGRYFPEYEREIRRRLGG